MSDSSYSDLYPDAVEYTFLLDYTRISDPCTLVEYRSEESLISITLSHYKGYAPAFVQVKCGREEDIFLALEDRIDIVCDPGMGKLIISVLREALEEHSDDWREQKPFRDWDFPDNLDPDLDMALDDPFYAEVEVYESELPKGEFYTGVEDWNLYQSDLFAFDTVVPKDKFTLWCAKVQAEIVLKLRAAPFFECRGNWNITCYEFETFSQYMCDGIEAKIQSLVKQKLAEETS